jgi:hypothetical protein
MALQNQGMNANCASYPKVSLGLGFKNPTREDSYLKSATPDFQTLPKEEIPFRMLDCRVRGLQGLL